MATPQGFAHPFTSLTHKLLPMAPRSDSAQDRPQKGINLAPVLLLIVGIVGAALAVAVATKKDKEGGATATPAPKQEAGPSAPSAPNPFGDIDNSPGGAAGTRKVLTNTAPPGLLEDPTYLAASVIANMGVTLANEAKAARDAGDEATFQKKGAVAKAKLDTAFERVADWLLEIQDLYPNDRQVAQVEREIQRWDRARRKVRVVR